MSAPKLTPAQVALLRAVAEGRIENRGGAMYYGSIDGRGYGRLVERVRRLDQLGLIDPYGVAMKHGRPKKPEERFADYHVVTLTSAGEQALRAGTVAVADGPGGGER
ncbi:hypothetical protein DMP23_43100 [Amycolatopsis sp. A1MSW2902]|uniref:hypothetical protein n=1 Tax=Amycolatopsis sp. A1MSW2902 TaxID=687413 RepID=UPI00307CD5E9